MKLRNRILLITAAAGVAAHAQSTLTWDVANPNDNWNTIDNNWTGASVFQNGDFAVFNDITGETVQVDAGGVTPGSTTILDGSWRFEGGSILGGTFAQNGPGTTVLTQSNGFSSVSLANGVLRAPHAGARGSGAVTHSGGRLDFSFGDGTTTTVANDFVLGAAGHPTFWIRGTDGAAPTTETTVRLTGEISGGTAGEIYRVVDTGTTGIINAYLLLDNPNNSMSGTLEMFRGFLGITSDAALGNADLRLAVGGSTLFQGGLRFAADNIEIGAGRSILFAASDAIDTGSFTATIHADLTQSGTRTFGKLGDGTLILTGDSTVSGTTILEGTLQVGNGGTSGSLGSGTVTNNATLVFDRSNDFNFNNSVDGAAGEIIKRGAGTMFIAANTDNKNSSLVIEEGRVVSQKGSRYFMIGHLVGGSGLANGAAITIESGAALDIDGNRNLDGDVNYALGARGNVQVTLNGGEMNFLGSASARDNIVGTLTANNGGSVAIGDNHRLDLNNSGGITTTGTGAMDITGTGTLNLAVRNNSGDQPVFDVGAGAPLTISTNISSIAVGNSVGGLGLEKTGDGTLTLNGTNTYAGGTTVTAGTLLVNGLLGDVAVGSATLGGDGTVGSVTVASGGTIAPGNSAGILATGNLGMAAGSTFDYEFGLAASDRVDVTGTLSLGGAALSLTDLMTGSLSLGDSLTLIGYSGAWDSTTFDGLANASTFTDAGYEWLIRYDDATAGSLNGGTGDAFVTLTVIPEPAAALLGGLGFLVLLRRRRG